MSEFVIKALNYGVLGLCAVMLVAVLRVLSAEQNRTGDPRPGIIKFATLFMVFCLALAVVNGYVQLTERSSGQATKLQARVTDYAHRLDQERYRLNEILGLLGDNLQSQIDSTDPSEKVKLKATINRLRTAAQEAQAADPE